MGRGNVYLTCGAGGELYRYSWTAKKTNKWVPEQIKSVLSLEAKMMKLRLSYFGHITTRHGSLEKPIILGKTGGNNKRGIPKYRMD